jgi:hypothetical protein
MIGVGARVTSLFWRLSRVTRLRRLQSGDVTVEAVAGWVPRLQRALNGNVEVR